MRVAFQDAITVSASVSCMDMLNLERDMGRVDQAPVGFYHFDVVDGRFNTCMILGSPTLEAMSKKTKLPIEVHIAAEEPELYLEQFVREGADYVAVHIEAMADPKGTFAKIKALGAAPVLAFRAETPPPQNLPELARDAAWILKLTVNPGFSGQKMQPAALDHIRQMRQMLDQAGMKTPIQADGNICLDTIPEVVRAGADILTGGTSGLFRGPKTVAENAQDMLECAKSAL